jgi:hypothetical protein
MFTLIVEDEVVYREFMNIVEQRNATIDDVLRDLLNNTHALSPDTTPVLKLLRLIDQTDLPFTNPFAARDAETVLGRRL